MNKGKNENVIVKGNLGWLFYKRLYVKSNKGGNKIKVDSGVLDGLKSRVDYEDDLLKEIRLISTHGFRLKVAYPGLLVGVGYFHGLPDDNSDIKMGFYFDYTTGLPTIPSSSIKGVLRSFFEDTDKAIKKEKEEFIRDILRKRDLNIDQLKDEIFEGIRHKNGSKENIPLYERDKFLDACIVTKNAPILAEDYLAPHEPFKEPIPIKMIKVRPGVEFEFNFILRDGIISADEKEYLFFRLLLEGGIGAKTASGYGHFEMVELDEAKRKRDGELKAKRAEAEKEQEERRLKSLSKEERLFEEYRRKNELTELVNKMKNNEIDPNEYDFKKLAAFIKNEFDKTPKQKKKKMGKKARERMEYIQSLLN
ncbi:type III-B CRISPR module RAMP protein Cmr6 [Hippea sp. KM1]|uniref:type III-B CRISPR module RAMP protein Cmr6 n=1 Tax=Hippea sp. KM1 TaxID=944481 RepID=UPI00046CA6A6|nr:type III-B CRISPR module RAMP protein Cmr6 [Hippea sp. KM1]